MDLNTQDLDEILGYSSSEILRRVERQHAEESKEMEPGAIRKSTRRLRMMRRRKALLPAH